jgi:anti-sigma B factor antagonist
MPEDSDRSVLVIRLEEAEWDISNRRQLSQAVESAVEHPRVVIDLSAARYFDSGAISVLLTLFRERIHERGLIPPPLVITAHSVRKTFKIVGLDQLWPLYATVEDAVAATYHHDADHITICET